MKIDHEVRLRTMIEALPASFDVWKKVEEYEVYTPANLYGYINGGAELYISFRFEMLISQAYVNSDGDEIRLDVFDMGSSANAYGLFAHGSEGVDRFVAPDVESEYAAGLLTFWKGRYFGSILAYPETESGTGLARELSRTFVAQVKEESIKPDIIGLLPQEGLSPGSIRYYLHNAWINHYRFFSNENLLNLDGDAEVAMARYRPAVLLIVRYPDPAAAAAAHEKFTAALLPSADGWLVRQDDGTWLGCRRAGSLVKVVADASERETAERLLAFTKGVEDE